MKNYGYLLADRKEGNKSRRNAHEMRWLKKQMRRQNRRRNQNETGD